MHTPPTNSRHTRATKVKRLPPLRPISFKVFIGYTDLAAVRDATDTIADAIRSKGRPFHIQPMLWRCDQLASDHWRDRAILAAQEADVIVLASSDPAGLGDGVEGWVNAYLAANRGRAATIIAVSGPYDAWTISIEETRPKTAPVASAPLSPPRTHTPDLVLSRR